MKIAVIGTGYVGLVTGTCFSNTGNEVWCADVDKSKIEKLKQGIVPFYEPGLDEMVAGSISGGNLHFTTDITDALSETNVCFIVVGTPPGEDGGTDLHYVLEAARSIGKGMCRHMYVVNKSTVPVGTAGRVRRVIQTELDARESSLTFDVISNPEFLREGSAVADCMKPDRIVIGTNSKDAADVMRELYRPYCMNADDLLFMDPSSAEMTKYAANAMLASRISFINEIADICERVGADVNEVRRGIGSDRRIGTAFIDPGCGYGGSCFSKDVEALVGTAQSHGCSAELLTAIENVNRRQKQVMVNKVTRRFGTDLRGKTFAVWGLAFKPDTDDMRDAPAITVIEKLTALGARVCAYDPKAMDKARSIWLKDNTSVEYCDSKYEALRGADALLLLTEWPEFRSTDFDELSRLMKQPVFLDGRNQFNAEQVKKHGVDYEQIGAGIAKEETI